MVKGTEKIYPKFTLISKRFDWLKILNSQSE